MRETELNANFQNFLAYNKDRIDKAFQISQVPTKIAVQAVPVFLNYNDKALPGYQETDKSYKVIPFFELTQDYIKATVSVAKNFSPPAPAHHYHHGGEGSVLGKQEKYLIDSLMLMGSVGTVAQNEKSDFDYWVVFDESSLSREEHDFLTGKLRAIEEWGDRNGIELHFFLTDRKMVSENRFGSADKESAGSSQAALLKEEFYRTAVHVTGKYPYWWVTPSSATDEEYTSAIQAVSKSLHMDKNRFIDLGNVHTIALKEFFGAALWQINKAMDSPFKSVLKMAMLESFISAEGEMTLLCDELKKSVINPEAGLTADPYLVLINHLFGYYTKKKKPDVVELLRKCLYNKVHIKLLSDTESKEKLSYKETIMLSYVKDWKWHSGNVSEMNDYDNWNFDQMSQLGNQLHGFLLETYKNLTDNMKQREQHESMISEEDLTVLGRKIFAYYGKKMGKVELMKKASDDALKLESVTFAPAVQRGKKPLWVVLRGNVLTNIARGEKVHHAEVKKGRVLPEVLFWLYINRVVGTGTFPHLVPSAMPVSLKEIQNLMKLFDEFIPYHPISSLPNSMLLRRAKTTRLIVVANFLSQSWAKTIEEITILFHNSHGESFMGTFQGEEGIIRAAAVYKTAMGMGIEEPHRFFKIFIPQLDNSAKLEKQLKNMILAKVKK
jgi:adenylate cyclase class 1